MTPRQKAILAEAKANPEGFALLRNAGDDRVAKNLSNKGLGWVQDNRWQYSWRRRSQYFNLFHVRKEGE